MTKYKPWLVLIVIFVVGILTGAALTIGLASHFMHAPGPQQIRNHWMMRLVRDLKLTPDQQAKIDPILADAETKIQALHRDEMEHGSQIFKAANNQIAAVLTPEQQGELRQIESDREKMFSRHMHPSAPPHDGADATPHHGGPDDGSPSPTNAPAPAAPAGT
jgi:protein CpxP